MIGKHAKVQHVRIGDQYAGEVFADLFAPVGGRIAIINGCPVDTVVMEVVRKFIGQCIYGSDLILGKGFEREEIKRFGIWFC